MKVRARILPPIVGLLLVACGTDADGDGGALPPPEETTTTTEPADNSPTDHDPMDTTVPDRGDPNAEPVPDEAELVVGEVPEDIMEAIMEDAADRSGMPENELTVRRAQAIVWPDGSLGCPVPGELYTQALVPGYWVEIVASAAVLDYRVDENGFFKVCDGQTTPHADSESDPDGGGSGTGYGSGEEIEPPGGSPDS